MILITTMVLLSGPADAALPGWKHIATTATTFTVSQDAQGYVLSPGAGFGCVVVDMTKPTGANTSPIACPTQTFMLQLRPPKAAAASDGLTVKATRGDDGALHLAYADLAAPAVGPGADFDDSPFSALFGLIPGTIQAELSIGVVDGSCGDESDPRGCAVSDGEVLFPAGGFGEALLASLSAREQAAPAACSSARCPELWPSLAADERWLKASGCGRQTASETCVAAAQAWRGAEVARRGAIVTKAVDGIVADASTGLPASVVAALTTAGTFPEEARVTLRQTAFDAYAGFFDKRAALQPGLRTAAVEGAKEPYTYKGDSNLEQMAAALKHMTYLDAGDATTTRAHQLDEEQKASYAAKFERAMAAQPTLRVQRAPDDSPYYYYGQPNLKAIADFLKQLDGFLKESETADESLKQDARRARFEREKSVQETLVDAAVERSEARQAAEERAANSQTGNYDRYENGQFSDSCASPLPGNSMSCNALIASCKAREPSDVGACIARNMSYAGLAPQQCLNCWD